MLVKVISCAIFVCKHKSLELKLTSPGNNRPPSYRGLVTCSNQLYITLMERLSIPRQLVIIAIYLLGSFTFNSTVGDLAAGVSLPPVLLVLTGLGMGIIISQFEAWLFKNRPNWFASRFSRFGRAILLSTVGLAMSFALVSGAREGIVCYFYPSHSCGGPPLFIKIILMSILLLVPGLLVGAVTGFAYHFILPSTSTALSGHGVNSQGSDFSASNRVGGIALFGILIAVILLLANHTVLGIGLLILCGFMLFYALSFMKRNSE